MLCYNFYHIKKNLPFDFVTFSVTDIQHSGSINTSRPLRPSMVLFNVKQGMYYTVYGTLKKLN